MSLSARKAIVADSAAITKLSNQLGYSITETDTLANLSVIFQSDKDIVVVALWNNEIAGWIHVFNTIRVESGRFCEIGGLVVDEQYQRKGIGRLLVNEARRWTTEQGVSSLRVRCNIKRTEAHDFYESIGFKENKQQKVFEIKS